MFLDALRSIVVSLDRVAVWVCRLYRCIDLFTDVTTFHSRAILCISSYANEHVSASCVFSLELKLQDYDNIFSDSRVILFFFGVVIEYDTATLTRERSLWPRISTLKRDIDNESRLTRIIRAPISELIGHADTNNEVITADNSLWWFNNTLNYFAVTW